MLAATSLRTTSGVEAEVHEVGNGLVGTCASGVMGKSCCDSRPSSPSLLNSVELLDPPGPKEGFRKNACGTCPLLAQFVYFSVNRAVSSYSSALSWLRM